MKPAKRILLPLAAVAAIAIGIVGMSAFEAHVINVTATITNATNVSTEAISFGTAFPQEIMHKPATIQLSQTFITSDMLGVDYKIKQKPKCKNNNPEIIPEFAHSTENEKGEFVCPEGFYKMPLLCPFLSKTSSNINDRSIPSFHGPIELESWTDSVSENFKAIGHLSIPEPTTTWDIDIHVPCFLGQCAQDWASYVLNANPKADPSKYLIDPALNGKMLGCDLWFEITNIDRNIPAPQDLPPLGSFSIYDDPSVCHVIVGTTSSIKTIQEGIDTASTGQSVCVEDGVYNEQITVNKALTIAKLSPSGSAVISEGALINSNNVTLRGFLINPGIILGENSGVYINGSLSHIYIIDSDIDGMNEKNSRGIVISSGGSYFNVVIENNKIHNYTTGIYTNPHTGSLDIKYNDIYQNTVGIGGFTGAWVQFNQFDHNIAGSEAIGVDISYDGSAINNNNFLNGTRINDYGAEAIIRAENNYFDTGGVNQTATGEVDYIPETVSQYPHH